MNDKKRIDELKKNLTKDIYNKLDDLKVESTNDEDSTRVLANILDGYAGKINRIESENVEEFEDELKLIFDDEVEVAISENEEELIRRYNDQLHDTIEAELTKNFDLDDMDDELATGRLKPRKKNTVNETNENIIRFDTQSFDTLTEDEKERIQREYEAVSTLGLGKINKSRTNSNQEKLVDDLEIMKPSELLGTTVQFQEDELEDLEQPIQTETSVPIRKEQASSEKKANKKLKNKDTQPRKFIDPLEEARKKDSKNKNQKKKTSSKKVIKKIVDIIIYIFVIALTLVLIYLLYLQFSNKL